MIQPSLVICTIVMILLMAATSTLAVVFAAKKKSVINSTLRNVSLILLLYMILGFMQYYYLQDLRSVLPAKILGILTDICYYMFIICWVRLLAEFSENRKIISWERLLIVTAIYGISAEVIVLVAGKYSGLTGEFFLEDTPCRIALMVMNCLYALWIFIGSTRYVYFAFNKMNAGRQKNGTIFFGLLLLIYMVWILIQDYTALYQGQHRITEVVVMDPLLVVYSALAIAVIYFFFKTDPLDLADSEDVQLEEKLQGVIEGKILTKREGEVLSLVCQGKNNPGIAQALCISENTVKRHLNNIFQKTGASNRYELISYVYDYFLLDKK